ncbi:MAG TPA: hypothetical protein VNI83_02205 [Vicinamibacterales bacterium]|nr:hypothetical protein [Vicinamibacterales bacterium]
MALLAATRPGQHRGMRNALPHVLTPEQQHFALWLALPERKREPRTQRALAAQFGVREATLSEWKHLPGFAAEVIRLTRELVKASDIAQIVHAQTREAKRGNTQAARFVLEFAGELGADQAAAGPSAAAAMALALQVNVSGRAVDDVTAARAAARELLARFTDGDPGAEADAGADAEADV